MEIITNVEELLAFATYIRTTVDKAVDSLVAMSGESRQQMAIEFLLKKVSRGT